MNTNNPITEIALAILAGLLIVGACILLFFGKIDFTGATLMFGVAAAMVGINQALKSPSPAQQTQLQQFMAQVLNTLPAVVSATQSQPASQPVTQVMQPAQPHVADEFTAPL